MSTGKIYSAIASIQQNAGALAPQKSGGVPFAFRGVDATVAHIAPHLREHNVIVVPEVLEHFHSSRDIGNKVLTQTELRTAFHFIHTEDGSEVVATTAGIAQDYADRSASQAQSVAFRVALLQTFFLPTNEKEPEERGEEVQRTTAEERGNASKAPAGPAKPTVTQLKSQIAKLVSSGKVTGAQIDEYGTEIAREPRQKWESDGAILSRIIDHFANA